MRLNRRSTCGGLIKICALRLSVQEIFFSVICSYLKNIYISFMNNVFSEVLKNHRTTLVCIQLDTIIYNKFKVILFVIILFK